MSIICLLQSTLLQCLLNELQPTEGNVDVKGTMSYAPQEPWMFSATLRENILFGKQYDRDLYDRVIMACALDKVSHQFRSAIIS